VSEINLDDIVGELEPHKVIIRGETFWANPDPGVGVLYDLWKLGTSDDDDASKSMESIKEVLTEIFGEQGDTVFQTCGIQRVRLLLGALMEAYAEEGKAPGSSRASRRAGGRSTQTSAATTTSTSAKRASARNGSVAAISPA
jgi:hypothetical protein